MREPGLIYRRAFPIDMGRMVVEEKWDIDVPGCPFIRSPWTGLLPGGPIFVRQVVMSDEEYAESKIPLFDTMEGQ